MVAATRYLVVANQTLGGTGLVGSVRARALEECSFHVVVPATEPGDEHTPAGGTGPENAQRRLSEALERLRAEGLEVTGTVGPADPMEANRGERLVQGLTISDFPHDLLPS